MDYKVYAIQSEKDGRIYVGFTEDLDRRIGEHNSGKTKSTKGFTPWKLIFQQTCGYRIEARKLEKYYKSGIGKEKLKQLVP
ncbi:GIY-YIG nuclease family protein [Draconibacterium halophilum]|uniref:GIY-YIG nuclease family protein n=1 Tax=Draconibacterium halophilum TaxID=2706887 RepID=A0A6C0RAH5_9BACT|nr:GIY-YIG nuclease family protein [Draconibacterium halophilum]QIA06443.1 GIY-YIG nuclease family protein [Draconibacterium halophilum]